MINNSTAYALPGCDIILKQRKQSPDEFISNLDLKSPILVAKKKFQNMWPIFNEVCELYNEDPVYVYRKNKLRDRKYVEIRQLTLTLFYNRLVKNDYERLYPLRVLGEFFSKDHCTAIYSIKIINNLRETNKAFKSFTDILFVNPNPKLS